MPFSDSPRNLRNRKVTAMQRTMRRKRQELPREEGVAMLDETTAGVLSLVDEDGCPYGVPLSFALVGETIYFHGAPAGRKLDALRYCGRGSFCVIQQDTVVPQKFTTYFRSAMACGSVRVVTDSDEARRALLALAEKYNPADTEGAVAEIEGAFARTCVFALDIEDLTAKEAIELVRERNKHGEQGA